MFIVFGMQFEFYDRLFQLPCMVEILVISESGVPTVEIVSASLMQFIIAYDVPAIGWCQLVLQSSSIALSK